MLNSNISIGYRATLLIVASPILVLLIVFSGFLLQLPSIVAYSGIIFLALNFVGFILFLISMYGLAKDYREPSLFRNTVYGFLTLVGGTLFFYLLEFLFFPFIFSDLIAIPYSVQTPGTFASLFLDILIFSVLLWVGMFVVSLVSSIFFRRVLYGLFEKTGEEKFKSAGFWIFLGGVLSIVVIGGVFVFVAWIYALLGFYSLNKKSKHHNI